MFKKFGIVGVLALVVFWCLMMTNSVKVSVIVPVYNGEKFLGECLESLKNQTLKEIEFIVINDGSSDKTYEIMEKYRNNDKRFKIYSKENEGVGKTRNMGLKIAKGEYVGFVDADDYVSKNYFEELYKNAKKWDADVSANGRFLKFRDLRFETHFSFAEDFIRKGQYFADDISYLVGDIGQQWDKIYKRSFLEKHNIKCYEKKLWFEDVWFSSVVAMHAKRIAFSDSGLYYYRFNPEGITQTSHMNKEIFDKGLELYGGLIEEVENQDFDKHKKQNLVKILDEKIMAYKRRFNYGDVLYLVKKGVFLK